MSVRESEDGRAPRILIVDDNRDLAISIAEYLKLDGYDVDVKFAGNAGIEAATTTQYNQIILDVDLPDVNGIDSMKAIRERCPNVPILLMTGYSAAYLASINLGDLEVLTKPIDLDELSARLGAAFRS